MLKLIALTLPLLFSVCSAVAGNIKNEPGQQIRVGMFSNPPMAFKDSNGEWRGLSVDVLQAIAVKHKWALKFVSGSFSDHLNNFETHKIDIISMMAYSEKRAKKYTFSKKAYMSNWGLVYARPGLHYTSILEMNGKRIAVMKNNIHDTAFRQLAANFDINLDYVELENFEDVFDSVQSGKVDAGVVNRLFGALNAQKYDLVETGIIFNPINIHYSSLDSDNKVILDVIDQELQAFKADKNSVYYDALRRWMNQSDNSEIYQLLKWVALALFSITIIMVGLAIIMRRQVAARTSELQLEVEERRDAERKLDYLAYTDLLTELPNRVSLLENIKLAIGRARRRNNKVAVLFIDIDRFKTVNDSLGHDAGDQLIIYVAKRLQSCLRDEDFICRFGGDEFVVVMQDISDPSRINHITERMLESLNSPVEINSTEIFASVCIGVSFYPDDGGNGEDLLKYSDAAMYYAKKQGGNSYQFYDVALSERVQERLSLEARLQHALERNEFRLDFQPIVNLLSQQPVGVEALIRWDDLENGLVMPDDFIPLAEETGLIVPIGEWVLENACRQVQEWEEQGLGKLLLSINVSSKQIDNNKLYSCITSVLDKTGFSAQQLELEITESIFLNITDNVKETLDKITNEGVRLSIDDFGTGYSSLGYLKQLPIDTLKIDRSFIMGIPEDKENGQIASTILAMASGLNLDVIAEGIETINQYKFLNDLNCLRGQGYYFSKPLPAEEIGKWLKDKLDTKTSITNNTDIDSNADDEGLLET